MLEQIGELAVLPLLRGAVEHEEARGGAIGGGLLGDEFGGKGIIKIYGAQGWCGFVHAGRT